jgi:hypothetical protein
MNLKHIFISIFWLCLFNSIFTNAQTPLDGLMMPKGEICVALVYEHSTWERYWEGTYLRTNQNIGTFKREMAMPLIVGGITDKINIMISLPFLKTSTTGGQMAGAEGLQDIGLSLKAQFLDYNLGKGKLKAFSNLSFSTPASNYLADYLPFSLGFGSNELGVRAIGLYEMNKGSYFRISGAYLHRGRAEAERNFYYQDRAFYTSTMDIPDALHAQVSLGSWFFQKKLRVEASITSLRCSSGDDIRTYNTPQPTNKVDFDKIEGFAQYYFKDLKGLGVLAYYNQMFSGRNMGQFSGFGLGLTYQFKAL